MKARIVAMLLLAVSACTLDAFAQGRKIRPAIRLAGRPAPGSVGRSAPGSSTRADARPEPRLAGRPVPAAGAARANPSASPAALIGEVLREANAARRRAGSRALKTDAALSRAARRYARELARRGEVEHVSATRGRRTFRDRIEAEGTRPRTAGENLARLTASTERLPDRVVRAWLESPGHRSNLLDPIFARTGIGVWLGADGVWYVVQVYATAT